MKTWLIIAGAAFVIWLVYELITSKPIPKEYLGVFIGGLGSGKTYLAQKRTIRWYKSEMRSYYLSCLLHPFKKSKRRLKPYVYSNIPLRVGNVFNRRMAKVLTKEILFLEEMAEPCSAFLFDELGQVANQNDYDLPAVKFNVQTHIRYMRQFYENGNFEGSEQCTDFVAKPIRGRFNIVINLRKLHRILFLPFGIVRWQSISMTQDIVNVSDVQGSDWNKYFFWMPYGRRYSSKPYSEARKYGFTHTPPQEWHWSYLKTRYVIDVRRECTRDIYAPAAGVSGMAECEDKEMNGVRRKASRTVESARGELDAPSRASGEPDAAASGVQSLFAAYSGNTSSPPSSSSS